MLCELKRLVHCVWWIDPDSGTTTAWKPASGLKGFLLSICSSVSICAPALLLSSKILSIPHFIFCPDKERKSPFQPFFPLFLHSPCPSHPVFNSSPLPPHSCWHRRTVGNWGRRELNNRPNPSAAILTARWMTLQHPQCKPLHFFSKCPALPVCPNVQRMPSWGIFLAMNASLFQTASNVPLSIGPQRERTRQGRWMT